MLQYPILQREFSSLLLSQTTRAAFGTLVIILGIKVILCPQTLQLPLKYLEAATRSYFSFIFTDV